MPALVRRPVPDPRMVILQFGAYAVGALEVVGYFASGNWTGLWRSAAPMLTSAVLLALNLLQPLWSAAGRGMAETAMFAAICISLANPAFANPAVIISPI